METDGPDPAVCSPVQLAAVMVDPIKLEVIKGSEFNIFFKPEKLLKDKDYTYDDSDILSWHGKVLGISPEKVLANWHEYPDPKNSWKMFTEYLSKYHLRSSKQSMFTAPLAAGYNIHRFDLKIVNRLSKKYKTVNKEGESNIFFPRDTVDLMNLLFYWFEGSSEMKNLTLDAFRDYFGISKDNAHDALKDVQDTASIIIRFLRLHRNLKNKIQFKNSFNEKVRI